VNEYGINFMSAPISKGENNISFVFEPKNVEIAMVISLTVFAILIFLLVFLPRKNAE
jgi:hypothetical protein